MLKYIVRRFVQSVPTLFGITFLSFLLMTAAPGGPTDALFVDPRMTVEKQKLMKARMGVDDPWYVQYVRWLIGDDWTLRDTDGDGVADRPGTRRGVLRGDFGYSFKANRPVLDIIGERVPATLELGITSLVIGLLVGVPVGILAAVRRGSWFDNVTRVFAVIITSVPIFWLGLLLILVFGAWLDILPMGGRCPRTVLTGCPPLFGRLEYLILPASVLAAGGIAVFSRFMRASTLDVIAQDYVRTARAKGMRDRGVWFIHTARNALIPIATLLGPAVTGVIGGAVVTESIFSWPGLGRTTLQAVLAQDYPVIMAGVIIAAIATIIGFMLSDVLYAIVDPRIRF